MVDAFCALKTLNAQNVMQIVLKNAYACFIATLALNSRGEIVMFIRLKHSIIYNFEIVKSNSISWLFY